MKDRVSLYPGRVKLTPVSGQENTYDMVRADSPTQEGTPLNKATLLKDATAALFGLDENAVPDDEFVEIARQLSERLQAVLLWENASPASEFGGQTISVDCSQYDLILIQCRASTDSISCISGVGKSGLRCYLSVPLYSSALGAHLYYRTATINVSTIAFSNGIRNTHDYNNGVIPYRIYGIKGVQTE